MPLKIPKILAPKGLSKSEQIDIYGVSDSTLRRYAKQGVPALKLKGFKAATARVSSANKRVQAYGAKHSSAATARYAERTFAGANHRKITLTDYRGNKVTVSGPKAGQLRKTLVAANQNRAKLGRGQLDFKFGASSSPDEVIASIKRHNTIKSLSAARSSRRESFRDLVVSSASLGALPREKIDEIQKRVSKMSGKKLDEMSEEALANGWDVINSEYSLLYGGSYVPDFAPLLNYLGMDTTQFVSKIR